MNTPRILSVVATVASLAVPGLASAQDCGHRPTAAVYPNAPITYARPQAIPMNLPPAGYAVPGYNTTVYAAPAPVRPAPVYVQPVVRPAVRPVVVQPRVVITRPAVRPQVNRVVVRRGNDHGRRVSWGYGRR